MSCAIHHHDFTIHEEQTKLLTNKQEEVASMTLQLQPRTMRKERVEYQQRHMCSFQSHRQNSYQTEDSETHTTVDWSADSSLNNSLHSHANDDLNDENDDDGSATYSLPITPPPTQFYCATTTKTRHSPSKLVINVTHTSNHPHRRRLRQRAVSLDEESISLPPSPCPTDCSHHDDENLHNSNQTYTSFDELGIITQNSTVKLDVVWKWLAGVLANVLPSSQVKVKDNDGEACYWWMKLYKPLWCHQEKNNGTLTSCANQNLDEKINIINSTTSPTVKKHAKQPTATTIDMDDDDDDMPTNNLLLIPPPPVPKPTTTTCPHDSPVSYVSFRDLMTEATSTNHSSFKSKLFSCPSWHDCKVMYVEEGK